MTVIKYQVKVEGYEKVLGLIGPKWITDEPREIEFKLEDISEEDREFLKELIPYSRMPYSYIIKAYLLDKGEEPNMEIALASLHATQGWGRDAKVASTFFIAEKEMELKQALATLMQNENQRRLLEKEIANINAGYKVTSDEIRMAVKQRDLESQMARDAAEDARLEEAAIIQWDDNGKWAVTNLLEKLLTVSLLEIDFRFPKWAAEVIGYDKNETGARAFNDAFVNEGLVEMNSDDKLYLVAAGAGSNKYNKMYYRFVALSDGTLVRTGISAEKSPGWELGVRGAVQAKLVELGIVKDPQHEQELDSLVDYQVGGYNRLVEAGVIVQGVPSKADLAMELLKSLFDVTGEIVDSSTSERVEDLRRRFEELRDSE